MNRFLCLAMLVALSAACNSNTSGSKKIPPQQAEAGYGYGIINFSDDAQTNAKLDPAVLEIAHARLEPEDLPGGHPEVGRPLLGPGQGVQSDPQLRHGTRLLPPAERGGCSRARSLRGLQHPPRWVDGSALGRDGHGRRSMGHAMPSEVFELMVERPVGRHAPVSGLVFPTT